VLDTYFLSVLCVALTVTFKSLPSEKCIHVLLYDLFLYCLYLNILPSSNLNSSPLSRDHVFHYVLYIEVLFRGIWPLTNKGFFFFVIQVCVINNLVGTVTRTNGQTLMRDLNIT